MTGKSEAMRMAKEAYLQAGGTVCVCSSTGSATWRRVRRNGRSFDLITTMPDPTKPQFVSFIDEYLDFIARD
ncbi:MAG TPA: hypothetical protein PLB04_18385 [Nitrospira sp.]|nr:hypothetical protein [Nitrospira sp.]